MIDNAASSIVYSGNNSTTTPYPVPFDYLEPDHVHVSATARGSGTVTVVGGVATFTAAQSLNIGDRVKIGGVVYFVATRVSDTVYTFTLRVDVASSVFYVLKAAVELAPSDFTLLDDGVRTVVAVATTAQVTVYRVTPRLQLSTLPTAGSLPVATVERGLDRLTMISQEIDDEISALTVLPPVDNLSPFLVYSLAQFNAAVSLGLDEITLGTDIPIPSGTLTCPAGALIKFNGNKFTQGGTGVIAMEGLIDEPRRQIFSGFTYGQITGGFSGVPILPEWWGLVADNHDIAINCAILTGGNKIISLGARVYDTSRPIDLRGSCCLLQGAGAQRTFIRGTVSWASNTFISSALWNAGVQTPNTHTALIWMGGSAPAVRTMFTGVRGVTVDGYWVLRAWPTKRVSCIASNTYIEENSILDDVQMTSFSGFGFGATPSAVGYGCTINGLRIQGFYVGPGYKADSYPLYFSQFAAVCSARDGTVDTSIGKAESASYAVADGNPIYSAPDIIRVAPKIGIWAQGYHLVLENIHVEGVTVAVLVPEGTALNNVLISGIDQGGCMDRGMVYINDPAGTPGPPPAPADANDILNDSCTVLISKVPGTLSADNLNYKDSVTIRNISNSQPCKYLLRDGTYGVAFTTLGDGQFPNEEASELAFYARPNAYRLPKGDPAYILTWWPGGNCTFDAATDVVTTGTTNRLVIGQIIIFSTTGTLPGGLVAGTNYYVRSIPTGTTLTLSATYGGGLLDITAAAGSGTHSWKGRYTAYAAYNSGSPDTDKIYNLFAH